MCVSILIGKLITDPISVVNMGLEAKPAYQHASGSLIIMMYIYFITWCRQ